MVDVSLYVHIPFCTRKCPYCHFYVIPDQERFKTAYLKALHQEWELKKPLLQDKNIVSVYFGGGTPSLLKPQALAEILDDISPPQGCEITLEANPENVTQKRMGSFAKAGINRVSLGVQSFDAHLLKILGRTHGGEQARAALYQTKEAGIDNLSIDLMYDLPHQTQESWEETLRAAISLPVTHLSFYNLTIEPHTAFYKKRARLKQVLPSAESSLEMLNKGIQLLEESGLKRYEISAFATKDCRSRHNMGYWSGRPFLGLGPSAFSYWDQRRFRNVAHLNAYCKELEKGREPIDFSERLSPNDQVKEQLVIGLRLIEGIDIKEPLPQETQMALAELQAKDFLTIKDNHVRLTKRGLLFHDSIAEQLV